MCPESSTPISNHDGLKQHIAQNYIRQISYMSISLISSSIGYCFHPQQGEHNWIQCNWKRTRFSPSAFYFYSAPCLFRCSNWADIVAKENNHLLTIRTFRHLNRPFLKRLKQAVPQSWAALAVSWLMYVFWRERLALLLTQTLAYRGGAKHSRALLSVKPLEGK